MDLCGSCGTPLSDDLVVQAASGAAAGARLCRSCASVSTGLDFRDPRFLRGAMAGLAAAVVGALVWALVVSKTGYQIGWVSWGMGWLVGLAVVGGSGGFRGRPSQIAAVAFTFFSLVLGEWFTVRALIVAEGFDAPLFLGLGDTASIVQESLGADPLTLAFWALGLWAAWRTTAQRAGVASDAA